MNLLNWGRLSHAGREPALDLLVQGFWCLSQFQQPIPACFWARSRCSFLLIRC